jgi:alpha-glucosidase
MKYPSDNNTYDIENQFFYGPSLLINPVTEESSTSVSFYVPKGTWYDIATQEPIARTIIPARIKGAMTTRALRDNDFELLIAPDAQGKARGSLYLDDGESLVQAGTSEVVFTWDGNKIKATGTFEFPTSVGVKSITIYGEKSRKYEVNMGLSGAWDYDVGSSKNS